jgi:hypothetical protein
MRLSKLIQKPSTSQDNVRLVWFKLTSSTVLVEMVGQGFRSILLV